MTDCSSIQGSTSSSSDAMSSRSDGGGSSCINTSSRIRVIRMIRPNSRRIVLGPENISIGFGFAVRGGKEFGTGFFVSRIEKGGEADSKGLRVGDQIIRVNGYNVEDAVHKELTQFISSQDRLTLKVRGVGMLPIKEKTLDTLTWHIVPRHALTTTLAALDEHMTIKDIRIILNVEPKTKLGLGICKGPEWKPGIFVQFTKDFSVARESGLRPGDQILSCNSIDFSDVLFSEAVAVMKSSQTLEMIVRTGAGLDLFPGESSGYNSSASSVTGDQSPCWGDQSAKRLSMVREESISKQWNENNCNNSTNLDRRKNFHKNLTRPIINNNNNNLNQCITTTNDLQPNNKTIIQLSESGTLINNTLITNPNNNTKSENLIIRPNQQQHHPQHLSMNFITPDYNAAALALNEGNRNSSNNTNDQTNEENNTGKLNGKIADICFVSRQSETKTVIVEVHRSAADENKNNNNDNTNDMNTNGIVNVARRSTNTTNNIPPKPPILPSLSLSSNTSSSSSPSPPSSVTDGLNDRSSSVASSIISSGGTSLCSAISEELKKRKERLSQCSNQTNNENNNNMETIINAANSRLQPKRGGCVSVLGGNDDYRHNALMDEFKRAHRKMFKNGFQETEEERQEELRKTSMMCDETDHRSTPHQQQTLPFNNNNHNNNNDIINKNHNQINHNNNKNYSNGHQNGVTNTELIQNNVMNNGQFPTPPPPPQFSNNPPMIKISDDDNYTENNQNLSIIPPPPPPETPIPDYDSTPMNSMRKQPQQQHYHANGCVRVATTTTTTSANVGTIGRVASTETAKANGDIGELESIDSFKLQNPSSPPPKPPSAYFVAQSSGPPTMKKSIRPVSVTIGEYGGGAIGYRKEPSKFDFIAKSNESSPTSSLPSPTTPTNNSIKDDSGNVSHMLRSELEMTLSRSNLKKRNEFDRNGSVINQIQNGGVYQNGSNGITQNGGGNGIQQIQNGVNKIQNGNCNYQKYQNDIVQNGGSKSVLHKTQSTNIEKLTNMLQNKQHIFEQNNNDRSATLTNSNRVTINIPNNKTTITTSTGKIELRKTESTPTNGILKNGLNRTSYIDKSISFGN